MNETMADMMVLEQKDGFPFHHIHATGSFGKDWMPKRVKDNGVDYENIENLDIREYIYNMPTVMAAAVYHCWLYCCCAQPQHRKSDC